MKCDICSSLNTYTKNHKHTFNIKGKTIEFVSERRFCKNCNNLVYDADLDNIASKKAIELYNEKYGLQKEKIIELRKKYNLSQELFSKIIGCARKTLISYEKGTALPNDNYIIIINSLINNPTTISSLIEGNKNRFTSDEYIEIENRIDKFLSNNTKQLFKNEMFTPTEYNGYTQIDKSKIMNMIVFFANNCVLKTKLLKEMFYADFLYYKEVGSSITGLEYAKINLGPVPDEFEKIINECVEEKYISYSIEFKNDYEYHNIRKVKEFDEKVFENDELEILNRVKNYFEKFSSKDIVNFSHEEKAFIETNYYEKISYDYAFDIDRVM